MFLEFLCFNRLNTIRRNDDYHLSQNTNELHIDNFFNIKLFIYIYILVK